MLFHAIIWLLTPDPLWIPIYFCLPLGDRMHSKVDPTIMLCNFCGAAIFLLVLMRRCACACAALCQLHCHVFFHLTSDCISGMVKERYNCEYLILCSWMSFLVPHSPRCPGLPGWQMQNYKFVCFGLCLLKARMCYNRAKQIWLEVVDSFYYCLPELHAVIDY